MQAQSRHTNSIKSKILSRLSLNRNSRPESMSLNRNSPPESTLREAGLGLQALLHDAVRFILAFRPVLEEAPLQLYHAGLVFSPSTSVIKEIFSPEAPAYLPCMDGVVPKKWSACFQTLKGHSKSVIAVAFSPDGKTLASGSWDYTVKVWDTLSGKELQTIRGHSHTVSAIAFSPDGKMLASASYDKTVKLWDVESEYACFQTKGHSDDVTAVAFSPDGKMLASASYDKTIKVWDTLTEKESQIIRDPNGVKAVAFLPDGKSILSLSYKALEILEVGSGEVLHTLKRHSNSIRAIAVSPDGKVASASKDGRVHVWDASSRKIRQRLRMPDIAVAVAFSSDGKTLASATEMDIILWDMRSGEELQSLSSFRITSIAFSPDGKTIALASRNKTIKMWNAWSGEVLQTPAARSRDKIKMQDAESGKAAYMLEYDGQFTEIVFSPDGKTLAAASWNEGVGVFEVESGKRLQYFDHMWAIAVAFSPDGKTLAVASASARIGNRNPVEATLWDVRSGNELKTLLMDADASAIAFSPDGKTLAVALPAKVRLWGVRSGNELQTLLMDANASAIAFSTDGKMLATTFAGDRVKVWDVGSGKVVQTYSLDPPLQSLGSSSDEPGFSINRGFLGTTGFTRKNALPWPASSSSMSVEGEWICRNGKRVLWLPFEYRSSLCAIHDCSVVFGYPSYWHNRDVLILKFVF